MPRYESWFRPWLDDPGPWPVWQMTPEEETAAAGLLREAVEPTCSQLKKTYGCEADTFGARDLVRRLADTAGATETLFRTALAIAAVDHYRARVTPRRPEPGGETNPVNRARWSRLQPFLMSRLTDCLRTNAEPALACCAISGRVAEQWISEAQLRHQLKQQLLDSDLFDSVEISIDLKLPVPGGDAWLHGETAKTLSAVRESLARRQPGVIEVLRDPATTPAAAQVLVVYRLEEAEDGWTTLACYDPAAEDGRCRLRLRQRGKRFVIRTQPASETLSAVSGLRLMDLAPARPPLFGLRRWLRWVLPWGPLWYVKRRCLVWYHRKREQAVSVLPSDALP